jgi:hypothetical protein
MQYLPHLHNHSCKFGKANVNLNILDVHVSCVSLMNVKKLYVSYVNINMLVHFMYNNT